MNLAKILFRRSRYGDGFLRKNLALTAITLFNLALGAGAAVATPTSNTWADPIHRD